MSDITLFFKRFFGKKSEIIFKDNDKTVHENIDDHPKIGCPICNSEIQPYWEPRYNGVRATCTLCGINWQES